MEIKVFSFLSERRLQILVTAPLPNSCWGIFFLLLKIWARPVTALSNRIWQKWRYVASKITL